MGRFQVDCQTEFQNDRLPFIITGRFRGSMSLQQLVVVQCVAAKSCAMDN